MTLSTTSSKISYAGNGSATAFNVPFKFLKNSHIVAVLRTDATGAEAAWTEGADYTLTGAGVDAGGLLTATAAPATGTTLVIRRIVPESQAVDLPLGGALPSSTIEDMVDRLTMMVQAHSEEIARAILLKATSPTSGLVLPEPEADKFLGWNAGGTNLENKASSGGGATDHGALTGLGDDDHPQYLLVADSGALAALDTVGAAQIDNNAVTLAKLADMATASFIGRNSAAAGDPEILSAATARTILNVADGAEANTASNAPTSADARVFKTKTGVDLVFRRLNGSSTVTVNEGTNAITYSLPNPLDLADGVLQRPEIKDFSITKKTATTHTGAVAINAQDGNVYVDTGVTGNLTLSVTNWPAGYGKIDVWLLSDATGGWTITLTGFTWATSAAAAMTASKWTRVVLETPDGGTTKFASLIWEGK